MEQRRASDRGPLCWVAMRLSQAWDWFDKFSSSWPPRLFWVGVSVWLYLAFAPSAWFLMLVPVHAVMGPLHGVIINWYAHKYGEVNFENRCVIGAGAPARDGAAGCATGCG